MTLEDDPDGVVSRTRSESRHIDGAIPSLFFSDLSFWRRRAAIGSFVFLSVVSLADERVPFKFLQDFSLAGVETRCER